MDSSDWSNGIRYHNFNTRPDTEFKLHRVARPCHAAYSNRAASHAQLGADAAAIEDAERCIALEPTWGEGYWHKGHVQFLAQQYGTARPG